KPAAFSARACGASDAVAISATARTPTRSISKLLQSSSQAPNTWRDLGRYFGWIARHSRARKATSRLTRLASAAQAMRHGKRLSRKPVLCWMRSTRAEFIRSERDANAAIDCERRAEHLGAVIGQDDRQSNVGDRLRVEESSEQCVSFVEQVVYVAEELH